MNNKYIGQSYGDPLTKEARKQAIIDMQELQKEYTERLPKSHKQKDRFIFNVHACLLNPKRIKQALQNNIVILLPL